MSVKSTTRFTAISGLFADCELPLDEALVLLVAERTPESRLGETPRELLQLLDAIGRVRFRAGQLFEMRIHVLRHVDRRLGRRLVPSLGNAGAALVADAAVVGGKGRLSRPSSRAGGRAKGGRCGIVSTTPCGGFQCSWIEAVFSLNLKNSSTSG